MVSRGPQEVGCHLHFLDCLHYIVSGRSGYNVGKGGLAVGTAGIARKCTFRQPLLTVGNLAWVMVPLATECASLLGKCLEPVCSATVLVLL